MTNRIGAAITGLLACLADFGTGVTGVGAQDLPTDAQVQAAFGVAYDRLGLMEYCASHGFATAADIAGARRMVAAVTRGITVGAAARGEEAVGRRGEIIGEQIVGLIDTTNPAHPELVPAGTTVSLADNARAQGTSEKVLCSQMAAQVAPLP